MILYDIEGIVRYLLILRWFIGAIFPREEWRSRVVTDADTVEDVVTWTEAMRANGWEDVAAIGDRLYLRRFVERWPYPLWRRRNAK